MKIYLSLLLSITCFYANAQTKKQTVQSKIDKVTVFMQGAQVMRSATTSIPAGTTTLVFPQISPELEEKSIQVRGQGPFTILSVSRERNYLRGQAPIEEIEKLQQQQEALEEKVTHEKARQKVFAQEEAMLAKNQDLRGTTTGLKTQDLREALDFQRARLSEVLEQQISIEKNITQLNESISRLIAQQQALMAAKDTSTSDLLITVSSKENINGQLTLSYMVKNAGWYPSYDLRVESISQPMALAYKANVFQQCGEEWKNVKLSLSSGNPSESGLKPELQPWLMRAFYSRQEMMAARIQQGSVGKNEARGRIYDESGRPLPHVSITIPGRTIGTVTNEKGEFSLQLPPDATALKISYIGYMQREISLNGKYLEVYMQPDAKLMEEVVVVGYGAQEKKSLLTGAASGVMIRGVSSAPAPRTQKQSEIPLEVGTTFHSTSVHFDIATAYTVPSDGKPYTVNIREMEVPASYEYHAAPKLDLSAYLLAGITDWQQLNLLEGETSIYFEGTYLGKSLLNLQTASDTLFVSLGKDKGIVLNRKLQKAFSKSQYLGSNQVVTRHWEISVRNNKREPVRLLLEDQLPVSVQREIEISKMEHPGAKLDENTQKLTWDLSIAPKEEKKTQLQYTVKYPKDRVVNLD
ncbi:DUF4139 domain-containing protein [Chitinophaga cymbidii]|uniref:Membrane protein n=1 Tax=Chitinophaga cymbidii TaxID=1096750 RepID=A0A512RE30_9BACT|nr:DUF4139 domain-containing protein [Chitinophaga cymbidii]GEP93966.1 membrane protein [Chitinophaga cymbidii]